MAKGINQRQTFLLVLQIICFSILQVLASNQTFGQDLGSTSHYLALEHYSNVSPTSADLKDLIRYPGDQLSQIVVDRFKTSTPYLSWNMNLLLVPSPPANTSPRTQAELEHLVALQKSRTPKIQKAIEEFEMMFENDFITQQMQKAWTAEDQIGPFFLGSKVFGKSFQRSKLPALRKLLNKSISNISHFCFRLKLQYNRARPHQLRPDIKSALPNGIVPDHAAYPSGHSCIAYGTAYILAEIDPKHQRDLVRVADTCALSREWAGIHYPSDNEASRLMSRKMVDLFLQNLEFQKDLMEAKQEWIKK